MRIPYADNAMCKTKHARSMNIRTQATKTSFTQTEKVKVAERRELTIEMEIE